MSRSLSSLDARECATFWSTRVRSLKNSLIFSFGFVTLTWHLCTDQKIVYRRYASLFFIAGGSADDNELITLEIVHRYVEQMDKYYGNVCELDIIFNFQKAYFILDELLLAGELQESSKKNVLRCINQQDSLEDLEVRRCFPFPPAVGAVRVLYSLVNATPFGVASLYSRLMFLSRSRKIL